MDGWRRAPISGRIHGASGRGALGDPARMSYAPPVRSRVLADESRWSAASPVYAQGQVTRHHQEGVEGPRPLAGSGGRGVTSSCSSYGAVDGKAAGGAGPGARLAGQAYESRQPHAGQLAAARLHSDDVRPYPRSAGRGSLRIVQRLPDGLSDRCVSGPYRLDARRCISYLTIEHKGPDPAGVREGMGNRIYGCDDCLVACPWNKFAETGAANRAFAARAELAAPRSWRTCWRWRCRLPEIFAGSPIRADRAGPDGAQCADRAAGIADRRCWCRRSSGAHRSGAGVSRGGGVGAAAARSRAGRRW